MNKTITDHRQSFLLSPETTPVYLPTSLFACGVWDHRALRCGVATKGHILDLVEASSRELRSSPAQWFYVSQLFEGMCLRIAESTAPASNFIRLLERSSPLALCSRLFARSHLPSCCLALPVISDH
jgi:hypothetical protein